MSSKPVCPLCKSTRVLMMYKANIKKDYFDHPYKISSSDYGTHLDILRCKSCDTIFEDVANLKKNIENHYETLNDMAYEVERDNRALAFKRIAKQIHKLKPSGELLDIGCATGAFLVEAQKLRYKVAGIEPSSWATGIAQKKFKLNVKTALIEEMSFPKNSFDIVTLLDVIEHLIDPRSVLQKTNMIMKKNGLLCIVTPDSASIAARILGERWWHIRPSHFYYFSQKTMGALLEETGYKIIKTRRYKWYLSADYLLERFLKMFGVQTSLNFRFLTAMTVGINLFDSMELYAIKK